MKNLIIGLSASAALTLGISSALASNHLDNGKSVTAVKKAPTFLFTISAKTGFIKQVGTNKYTLTMNLPPKNQVLMFSDRPERIVKRVSAESLAKIGANNFIKNPPNAVLSSQGMEPTIVIVTDVQVNGNQVTYLLKTEGNDPKPGKLNQKLNKVILTIDGLSLPPLPSP